MRPVAVGNRYHAKPRGARGENCTPGSRTSWRGPSRDRGQRRGAAGINTLTSVYCHLPMSCPSLSLRSEPRGRQRPGSWRDSIYADQPAHTAFTGQGWGKAEGGLCFPLGREGRFPQLPGAEGAAGRVPSAVRPRGGPRSRALTSLGEALGQH